MSYNSISTFFLIVALLYATANPLAHATLPRTISVVGRFCCATNGNCLATSVGVAGVPVNLSCSVLLTRTVVATATTDVDGNFFFTRVSVPAVTLPSRCVVTVTLPLTGAAANNCSLLATAAPRNLTARLLSTNGIFPIPGASVFVAGSFV